MDKKYEERDKFLMEAMGLCWHDWIEKTQFHVDREYYNQCTKCGVKEHTMKLYNKDFIDFSSGEGFFQLWNWVQKQEWLEQFLTRRWVGTWKKESYPMQDKTYFLATKFVHPDRFAHLVYEFLKEDKRWSTTNDQSSD